MRLRAAGSRIIPRRVGAVAVACCLLGSVVVAGTAGADQVSDKRAEASAVADRLERLDAQMMDINAQYERAVFELATAEQRVADAKSLAEQTQKDLERRQDDLHRYAVVAYQTGNDSPELDAILSSDADTGFRKRTYLESVSGNRRDLIDALHASKQRAAEDSARLEVAEQQARNQSASIEKARTAQAAAVADQQALSNRVQGELATLVAQETARRAAAHAAPTGTTRPNTPTTIGGGGTPVDLPAPPVGRGAAGAVAAALSRVGAPYVWGAAGPTAFDCSGLVVWAYAQVGISLPHYSGAQYLATTRISASQLQPGDLVFYGPGGSEHVGIYMGGDQLVQAAHGIAITNFTGWWKDPVGYGRVVG